jgi:NAD-dependent deacetylase
MEFKLLRDIGITVSRDLHVVVLTGAGISAESGVPVFRGRGSMWENPTARRLASHAHPPWNNRGTWEFYEWRRQLVAKCSPNAAHYTLVEMESFFKRFCLITQNVDGLHKRAGSRNVIELHGNMWRGRCLRDGEIVELPETPLKSIPPLHSCGEALRPHVVQFGEAVLDFDRALRETMMADLFFVIGTSGVVSPARDLPLIALRMGAKVVEINPEETVLTPYVTVSIRGRAAEVLPKVWREILKLAT